MFGDKFNLVGLMKNAKKMQEMMEKAQEDLKNIIEKGEAGAGDVVVTMAGDHTVRQIHIDPKLLEGDKAILEDLLIAAINNATDKVNDATKSKLAGASELLSGSDDA